MLYKLTENRVYRTYLGGRKIDAFSGRENGENSFFPEDWTASVVKAFNPGRESIEEGFGKTESGVYVKDLLSDKMRCLVKLLDTAERLVIQVHPTTSFAKKFFSSEYGKTECWYFLDCEPDACVYLGFKENVTKKMWRVVFDKQDIPQMLSMLHKFNVKKGDCVFIEGGLPHAIGAGCFMIEVQEPSDLMGVTEKTTPSGKILQESKLHSGIGIDNMFKMFDYSPRTAAEAKERAFQKQCVNKDGICELVNKSKTEKFSITILSQGKSYTPVCNNGVIIITDGEGKINNLAVKKGDRLFYDIREKLKLSGSADLRVVICC